MAIRANHDKKYTHTYHVMVNIYHDESFNNT